MTSAACSGTARGLEAYRTDTQKLLETRSMALRSCYESALRSDTKLAGTVAIKFIVEKKTGALRSVAIDASSTSAPSSLGDCVLQAVDGLKLEPPDRNDGHAMFVYEFKPATT
jgi:predicted membrane-bound mannosyltransferase